jgi:hypothetical protein
MHSKWLVGYTFPGRRWLVERLATRKHTNEITQILDSCAPRARGSGMRRLSCVGAVWGGLVEARNVFRLRLLLAAAIIFLPAGSSCAQTYDGVPPRAQEPTRTIIYQPYIVPSMCDLGSSPIPAGSGAAERRAALLDKDGPQQPPVFSMSAFSIMGFTRGNWPVVIDYLLESDSLVIAVVAPEGAEPIIFRLDGKKGHWQARLTIPAAVGDRPVVAQYVIRSLTDNAGQAAPVHIHIHGIAAGPKAVGSIGIDRVTVGPGTVNIARGEKAHYTFHSLSDFKHSEVNFVRVALANGEIIAARVARKSTGSVSKGTEKDGDWDGKSDGSVVKVSSPEIRRWLSEPRGQHLVQVRAWWGSQDGGDWVAALSENFVTIE